MTTWNAPRLIDCGDVDGGRRMDAGPQRCWRLMEGRGLCLAGHRDVSRDVEGVVDRPGMTEGHMTARAFLLILFQDLIFL